WLQTARANQQRLLALLDAIHAQQVPEPDGDYDSLVEFDRRRVLKEQLLYAAIGASLDTSLALNALRGVTEGGVEGAGWGPQAGGVEQALCGGGAQMTRARLGPFLQRFQAEPLLFTPLTEGGSPRPILRVRVAQSVLGELLANLPRLGLLRDTFEV